MKADYKPNATITKQTKNLSKFEAMDLIERKTIEMQEAAKSLEFEKAATLRDEILLLRKIKNQR
jgi:excinuclease UvrABC helicase subunit UvrB